MTILKINAFTGMIPRLPPERLPDGAAEYAKNCDFSYGELRSLKGPGTKFSTTQAVRSLFTPDGTNYFTWPTPTRAYLAPTIDDAWGRVYFNTEGQGLRAAQRSTMKLPTNNPGPPGVSYKVGVRKPDTGGYAISRSNEDTTLYAQIINLDGSVLRQVDVTGALTPITMWEQYSVTVPPSIFDNLDDGTPRTPDVGGWLLGSVTAQATYGGVSESLLGGAWWINDQGHIKAQKADQSTVTYTNVDRIVYNGVTYEPSSGLFAALTGGVARQSFIQFWVNIVFQNTGKVFYNGRIPHAESSTPGTYILSVPDSVAGEAYTIACCATVVNEIGEESAPDGPVLVEWRDNGTQTLELSLDYTPDPDQIPVLYSGAGVNFYRTYGNTPEYFLINETPIPLTYKSPGVYSATLTDDSRAPKTTTALQSEEWDEPPSGLKFLTYAGNGSFCAAVGKDLCFSEPFRPHAWPYRMMFPQEITGIIEVEGGVLVTTTLNPYFVYGSHPAQLTQQALNAEQAGVGYRAMARLEGAAIYASNDGLVRVAGGQASVKDSQQLFTREVWRNKYKTLFSHMVLSAWDGKLIGVIDGNVGENAAIFNLEEGAASNTVLVIPGETITGIGISSATDQVGLLYANGFAEFGVGSPLALDWKSKVYEFPLPVSFAACVVRHDGTFSVEFYRDGILVNTQALAGATETAFRLPAVGSGKRWQVRITGTGAIKSLEMGASFAELKNG